MSVLILFAGTGVPSACRQLQLPTHEVEPDGGYLATRASNGFITAYTDPLDVEAAADFDFDVLWASPPTSEHRDISASIRSRAWREYDLLIPMAYVERYAPRAVIFEQDPDILPIWDVLKPMLQEQGYSVWTGYIEAESLGLAQIQRRAYLIARRDGIVAGPPQPTHSRYDHALPNALDTGVKVWRSAAEALDLPGDLWLCSPHHERPLSVPARTLTLASAEHLIVDSFDNRVSVESRLLYRSVSQVPVNDFACRALTVAEAAALQGFPPRFAFVGGRAQQFTQVTGAVPPPVAAAVLNTVRG